MKRSPKYIRAMLKAIDQARTGILTRDTTRTYGLRAIRDFERVNGIDFDPFDDRHVHHVRGMGPHAELFRKLKIRTNQNAAPRSSDAPAQRK